MDLRLLGRKTPPLLPDEDLSHPPLPCVTYSFFIWRTWSMVTTPAQLKLSLYWLILMDSSHSDTDLKGEPSEPLVLGRRMDTLRERRGDRKEIIITRFSHNRGEAANTVITVQEASERLKKKKQSGDR